MQIVKEPGLYFAEAVLHAIGFVGADNSDRIEVSTEFMQHRSALAFHCARTAHHAWVSCTPDWKQIKVVLAQGDHLDSVINNERVEMRLVPGPKAQTYLFDRNQTLKAAEFILRYMSSEMYNEYPFNFSE